MAILDAMFGRMFNSGAEITLTSGINFTSGVRGVFNQATKLTDVSISPAGLDASAPAAPAAGVGVPFVLTVAFTAGTPGTADDVTVQASAPRGYTMLDRWVDVSTAVGASTARLRSASGGGGNALSGSFDTSTACEGRRASSGSVSAASAVASAGAVFLRRSDRGIAGRVHVLCVPT